MLNRFIRLRVARAHLILPPFPFLRKEKILPLNLGYLAAGFPEDVSLEVLDANLLEWSPKRFTQRVAELHTDALLFTSHTYQIPFVAEAAAAAKRARPDVLTVVGGPHISQVPEETLRRYPSMDIAVIGEGDRSVAELIQAAGDRNRLLRVPGLVLRENGGTVRTPQREPIQDLDSLPFPAWDRFPLSKYSSFYPLKSTSIPILTSRGCPFKCRFCNRALGDTVRYRGLASVFEELDRALSWGIREFEFADESFTLSRGRVHSICDHLIRLGPDRAITWVAQTRVDLIHRELLARMAASGCLAINFGVESGSQEVLDSMGKGITLEQIRLAVETCRQTKVKALVNVILGGPKETPRTLRATSRLVVALKPDRLAVNQLVAFPGTEFHGMAERQEQGMRLLHGDWGLYHPQMKTNLRVSGVTQRQLTWYQFSMYVRFYLLQPNRATLGQLLSLRSLWQYSRKTINAIFG